MYIVVYISPYPMHKNEERPKLDWIFMSTHILYRVIETFGLDQIPLSYQYLRL